MDVACQEGIRTDHRKLQQSVNVWLTHATYHQHLCQLPLLTVSKQVVWALQVWFLSLLEMFKPCHPMAVSYTCWKWVWLGIEVRSLDLFNLYTGWPQVAWQWGSTCWHWGDWIVVFDVFKCNFHIVSLPPCGGLIIMWVCLWVMWLIGLYGHIPKVSFVCFLALRLMHEMQMKTLAWEGFMAVLAGMHDTNSHRMRMTHSHPVWLDLMVCNVFTLYQVSHNSQKNFNQIYLISKVF